MSNSSKNGIEYVQLNSHEKVTNLAQWRVGWNVSYFGVFLLQLMWGPDRAGLNLLSLPGMVLQFVHIGRYTIISSKKCYRCCISSKPAAFRHLELYYLFVLTLFSLVLRLVQLAEVELSPSGHVFLLFFDLVMTLAYLGLTFNQIWTHSEHIFWVLMMETEKENLTNEQRRDQ